MLKRLLDIVVSGAILLVLALPLTIIIVILKLTGEHEAFYFQDRIGFLGKIIQVTKFATMVKDSPNLGTQDITLRNDPRVLPVGKFLRKTKLNEVPQFWDVFVGKLSLVGWRPLMPKGFADYPQHVQQEIVKVKPGLTGIGSLVFRDEEAIIARAETEGRDLRACYREDIMPYKGALEVWYVAHQGLWTDLKILVGTAVAVLKPGWTGYAKWLPNLPQPESSIIREYLGLNSTEQL
ncbi:sugar transferase [Aureliella helgolandensis]|uniref:UDP-glucose:undecaprenyl-phosphate glucose-1-phosphate transferase n=1 Tax=Aureliella helgolandensis TaxID=2527968 RepID=A0A518GC26_9BACT|nr:sugar transferase [Aureliella helgolandensis]QDV26144.1 UDP-glucose:undecaprenyl-phosphate glucose-1-phosphate transferase [Aureliella helgolandensis]